MSPMCVTGDTRVDMVGYAARTCGEFPPLSEPSSRTRGSPLKAEHETTLTLHSNFNFQAAKCETAGLAEGESTEGALGGGEGEFRPGNLRREGPSVPLEQGSDLRPRTRILWGTLGTVGGHSAYWMLGAPRALAVTPQMSPGGRTTLLCSTGSGAAFPSDKAGSPRWPGSDQQPRAGGSCCHSKTLHTPSYPVHFTLPLSVSQHRPLGREPMGAEGTGGEVEGGTHR